MSITLKNIQAKKADIIKLSQRYHAENIRVFGSVARGEATDSSDVDFLVSFLPNARSLSENRTYKKFTTICGVFCELKALYTV